jgi:hypothetical protein
LQAGFGVFALGLINMKHFDMRVGLQPRSHFQASCARLTINKYPKTHAAVINLFSADDKQLKYRPMQIM